MIDKKTIEKAAKTYCENVNEQSQFMFAIDWFKANIWHFMRKDEQKPGVPILYQVTYAPQKYYLSYYTHHAKTFGFRWCYIDDLNFNDSISSEKENNIIEASSIHKTMPYIDPHNEHFNIAKEIFLNYFKNEQDLRGLEEPIEAFSERIADNACKAAQTFVALYMDKYGEHEEKRPSYYALQQP